MYEKLGTNTNTRKLTISFTNGDVDVTVTYNGPLDKEAAGKVADHVLGTAIANVPDMIDALNNAVTPRPKYSYPTTDRSVTTERDGTRGKVSVRIAVRINGTVSLKTLAGLLTRAAAGTELCMLIAVDPAVAKELDQVSKSPLGPFLDKIFENPGLASKLTGYIK